MPIRTIENVDDIDDSFGQCPFFVPTFCFSTCLVRSIQTQDSAEQNKGTFSCLLCPIQVIYLFSLSLDPFNSVQIFPYNNCVISQSLSFIVDILVIVPSLTLFQVPAMLGDTWGDVRPCLCMEAPLQVLSFDSQIDFDGLS